MGVTKRLKKRMMKGDELCLLCGLESDEAYLGQLAVMQGGVRVHENCLFFSPVLRQVADPGRSRAGFLMGFRVGEIKKEARRAGRLRCSVCRERSAGIGCCDTRCRRSFHLACGLRAGARALFTDTFQFYCREHASRPDLRHEIGRCAGQVPDCAICLEPAVDPPTDDGDDDDQRRYDCAPGAAPARPDRVSRADRQSPPAAAGAAPAAGAVSGSEEATDSHGQTQWWTRFERAVQEGLVMHGQCCRQSWAHRACVQQYALSAGRHHCRCPLCSDTESFHGSLLEQGIWLPDRDASWELEPGAFRDMYEVVEEEASPIRQSSTDNTADAVGEASGYDISSQPDDDLSQSRSQTQSQLESPSTLDSVNNTTTTVTSGNCSESSEAGTENDENTRPIGDDIDNINTNNNNNNNKNKINNNKINKHTNSENLMTNTRPETKIPVFRSNSISVATGKKRPRLIHHDTNTNTNSNSSVSDTSGGSAGRCMVRQHQQTDIRQYLCCPGATGSTRSPTTAPVPQREGHHIAPPLRKRSRLVANPPKSRESPVSVPPLALASPTHASSLSSSPSPSTTSHNRKRPRKSARPILSPAFVGSSIASTSDGTSSNTRVILTRNRSAFNLRHNNSKINNRQSPGFATTSSINIGCCDRCSRTVVCLNGSSVSKHRSTASSKGFICVSCSL